MAILELIGLSKAYTPGKLAVDHVSLTMEEGEILCLLGPSGCGKTTLLRMIAGLETADSGEVWFDGQNMAPTPPYSRDFGMMFQDFALFPHKNVAENIAFGLNMHHWPADKVAARVDEMLALVALPGFGDRDVSLLSGGEQQRVALARSLAPEPRLLLLDEPLGSLDRALRERLMLDVRQILKELGMTAVYVTHDQTEAFAVADRVALMNAGHIEQLDTPRQVYCCPATEFAARFLGFRNLLSAVILDEQSVRTELGDFKISGSISEPQGGPVTLLIRPDAAELRKKVSAGTPNLVHGTVRDCSFRGRYTYVWVETASTTLLFEFSDADLRRAQPVDLYIDPEGLNILPA
ncbi:MAG: ABC transporter ATP-binding protein [Candidatus Promineifilaceae bacterium]